MKKVIIAVALSFFASEAWAQAVIVKRAVYRPVVMAPRVIVAPRPVVMVRPVVVRPLPLAVRPARVVIRKTVIYK